MAICILNIRDGRFTNAVENAQKSHRARFFSVFSLCLAFLRVFFFLGGGRRAESSYENEIDTGCIA